MKLTLASKSPRRKDLLQKSGLSFEVISPRFEEKPTSLSAAEETLYFAEEKARSVAALCPNALVIGSDTLIECDGKKLGKPKDKKDAIRILSALSGKQHVIHTAVVLLNTQTNSLLKHREEVQVTFKKLSQKEIETYVATGEPMGKAGAYAIQGKGKTLLEKVEGDEEAAIGLPLTTLKKWLKEMPREKPRGTFLK